MGNLCALKPATPRWKRYERLSRRTLLAGGLGLAATSASGQHEHHTGQFERLNAPAASTCRISTATRP
jgi:hypothetical protein